MSINENTATSRVDVYTKVTSAIINAIEQGVGALSIRVVPCRQRLRRSECTGPTADGGAIAAEERWHSCVTLSGEVRRRFLPTLKWGSSTLLSVIL